MRRLLSLVPILALVSSAMAGGPRVVDFRAGGLVVNDPAAGAANLAAMEAARDAAPGPVLFQMPAGTAYISDSFHAPFSGFAMDGIGRKYSGLQVTSMAPVVIAGLPPGPFTADDFPDTSAITGNPGHGWRLGKGRWAFAPFQSPTCIGLHTLPSWTIEVVVDFGASGPVGSVPLCSNGQQFLLAIINGRPYLQVNDSHQKPHTSALAPGNLAGVHAIGATFNAAGTVAWTLDGKPATGTGLAPAWPPGDTPWPNLVQSFKLGGWHSSDGTQSAFAMDPAYRWTLAGCKLSKGTPSAPATAASIRRPDPQTIACLEFTEGIARAATTRKVSFRNGPASAMNAASWAILADDSLAKAGGAIDTRIAGMSLHGGGSVYGVTLATGLNWDIDLADLELDRNGVGLGVLRLGANYVLRTSDRIDIRAPYVGMSLYGTTADLGGMVDLRMTGLAGIHAEMSAVKFARLNFYASASPITRWFVRVGGNLTGDLLWLDNEDDAASRGPLEALVRVDPMTGSPSVVDVRTIDYACTPPTASVVLLANAGGGTQVGKATFGSIACESVTNARAVIEVADPCWRAGAGLAWKPPALTPILLDSTPGGSATMSATDALGGVVPVTRPRPVPIGN